MLLCRLASCTTICIRFLFFGPQLPALLAPSVQPHFSAILCFPLSCFPLSCFPPPLCLLPLFTLCSITLADQARSNPFAPTQQLLVSAFFHSRATFHFGSFAESAKTQSPPESLVLLLSKQIIAHKHNKKSNSTALLLVLARVCFPPHFPAFPLCLFTGFVEEQGCSLLRLWCWHWPLLVRMLPSMLTVSPLSQVGNCLCVCVCVCVFVHVVQKPGLCFLFCSLAFFFFFFFFNCQFIAFFLLLLLFLFSFVG